MNSASQDFPHHLGILREKMLHPTEYDQAVNYFLEEFAGDEDFVRLSDQEQMPQLVAVLERVVSQALNHSAKLEGPLVSHLREHRFVHGNAQADGRIVLFFYFQAIDAGMAMIIPGMRGDGDVARFRLTVNLTEPQKN